MNDDKKKVILSVIGILLLVVGVFGVTYAFFNYSRTGATDNQITSGKLLIKYEEGSNVINLTEEYPISDDAGLQQSSVFNFTVSGYIEGNNSINYTVYGVLGDPVQNRVRLKDYEMKIKLTGSNSLNIPNSISINNNYDSSYGNIVGDDGVLTNDNDLVLATGVISSNVASVSEVHTYTLKMWIPNSVVSIHGGETTTTGNTAGSTTVYSSLDYENLYYSMKINVVASDGTAVETN